MPIGEHEQWTYSPATMSVRGPNLALVAMLQDRDAGAIGPIMARSVRLLEALEKIVADGADRAAEVSATPGSILGPAVALVAECRGETPAATRQRLGWGG